VSRSNRVTLDQPVELVREATRLAAEHGHPLATYLHGAVVNAVHAAEAGRADLLPYQPPRPPGFPKRRTTPAPEMTKVAITVAKPVAARWIAALDRQQSSLTAVVTGALEAFVEARGSWLDTITPGMPGRQWRSDQAA
jgi:hypothetical protein